MKSHEIILKKLLEDSSVQKSNTFVFAFNEPQREEYEILSSEGLVKLVPYTDGGFRIDILPPARLYFSKKRKERFRFWFPVIISILALVISIISLLKRL